MNKFFKVMGLALVASAPVFGAAGFDRAQLQRIVAACTAAIRESTTPLDRALDSHTLINTLSVMRDAGQHVLAHGLCDGPTATRLSQQFMNQHFRPTPGAQIAQHAALIAVAVAGTPQASNFHILTAVTAIPAQTALRQPTLVVRTSSLGFVSARDILTTGNLEFLAGRRQVVVGVQNPDQITSNNVWSGYVGRAAQACAQDFGPFGENVLQQVNQFLSSEIVRAYLEQSAQPGPAGTGTEVTVLTSYNLANR